MLSCLSISLSLLQYVEQMGLDETLEAKLLDFYFNKRDYNQDEFVSRAEFYNAATSHDEL